MDQNDPTVPAVDKDSVDPQDTPTTGTSAAPPPRLSSDPDPDPDADVVAERPPGQGEPAEHPDPMPGE